MGRPRLVKGEHKDHNVSQAEYMERQKEKDSKAWYEKQAKLVRESRARVWAGLTEEEREEKRANQRKRAWASRRKARCTPGEWAELQQQRKAKEEQGSNPAAAGSSATAGSSQPTPSSRKGEGQGKGKSRKSTTATAEVHLRLRTERLDHKKEVDELKAEIAELRKMKISPAPAASRSAGGDRDAADITGCGDGGNVNAHIELNNGGDSGNSAAEIYNGGNGGNKTAITAHVGGGDGGNADVPGGDADSTDTDPVEITKQLEAYHTMTEKLRLLEMSCYNACCWADQKPTLYFGCSGWKFHNLFQPRQEEQAQEPPEAAEPAAPHPAPKETAPAGDQPHSPEAADDELRSP